MPYQYPKLVVISAAISDQEEVIHFFERADYLLEEMAFIILASHDEEQEKLMHILAHRCNGLCTQQVDEYTALEAGNIYFIPHGKHIVLNEGAFVHNNAMNSRTFSSNNSFWESVATYHAGATCISMQVDPAHLDGMLLVRDAGGMMLLQETGVNTSVSRRQTFLAEFDYILKAENMPFIIKHHQSEQFDWIEEEELNYSIPPSATDQVDYSTTVGGQVLAPAQFNEWAAKQFSPAVLFICPITGIMVHATDSVRRILLLPSDFQGQVYTGLSQKNIVQAIGQVIENIEQKKQAVYVHELIVEELVTNKQANMIRLVAKKMKVDERPLLVLKLEADYWTNEELQISEQDIWGMDETYRKKINELGELNDDLTNILQSTDIGTLFLDNELRVRKFTNSILQHLYLKECQLGVSIKDLAWLIKYEDLVSDAIQVLQTKRFIEREVEHENGEWFQVRIHPYATADYTINGLVITFLKVSNIKKLKVRLNELSEELEKQGLELVRTMMELREEVSRKKENAANLAQQNALLASVLNSMSDGIIAINEEGQVFMLNEMATAISGIEKGGSLASWMETKEFLHIGTHRLLSNDSNPFHLILKGNEIHNIEIGVQQKGDLGLRYWKVNALPLRLQYEGGKGIVIAISDITRQKLYEISLHESEQTKKAILEAIPDVLFRLNKEGICLDYIPNADQSNIPTAAFVDNHICDVLPTYAGQGIMETMELVLKDKTMQTYHFEVLENDVFHFYETRISIVKDNEVLCMIRDITDQVVAEEAMQKSVSYFRQMITMNPAPVVLHDRKGKIKEANPALLKMIGATSIEDIEDRSVFSFIVQNNQRNEAKTAIKRGYTDEFPDTKACYSLKRLDGSLIKVEATGTIITYQNQLIVQVVLKEL